MYSYKDKYLKYKSKYFQLKNLYGSSDSSTKTLSDISRTNGWRPYNPEGNKEGIREYPIIQDAKKYKFARRLKGTDIFPYGAFEFAESLDTINDDDITDNLVVIDDIINGVINGVTNEDNNVVKNFIYKVAVNNFSELIKLKDLVSADELSDIVGKLDTLYNIQFMENKLPDELYNQLINQNDELKNIINDAIKFTWCNLKFEKLPENGFWIFNILIKNDGFSPPIYDTYISEFKP
jgi:hypothetical protein